MRPLLLLALAGLLACSDSAAPVEPATNHAGVYVLMTINGTSLPFLLFEQGGDRVEVLAGRVTLREDRTFEDSATLLFTEDGVELPEDVDVITGTYTVAQGRVRFSTSDGFTYEAVLSGDNMTQTFDGLILIYQR